MGVDNNYNKFTILCKNQFDFCMSDNLNIKVDDSLLFGDDNIRKSINKVNFNMITGTITVSMYATRPVMDFILCMSCNKNLRVAYSLHTTDGKYVVFDGVAMVKDVAITSDSNDSGPLSVVMTMKFNTGKNAIFS